MSYKAKCNNSTYPVCEPENICKDITTCVNCNRELHHYEGVWYHWPDLPVEADDSDFGIQMRLLNQPHAEG